MFGETGSVVSLTGHILPAVFMSEQVRGFDKPYTKNGETSPKTDFVSQIMGIKRRNGTLHFSAWACAAMDSKMFVHGSRPRCPKSCLERLHTSSHFQYVVCVVLAHSVSIACPRAVCTFSGVRNPRLQQVGSKRHVVPQHAHCCRTLSRYYFIFCTEEFGGKAAIKDIGKRVEDFRLNATNFSTVKPQRPPGGKNQSKVSKSWRAVYRGSAKRQTQGRTRTAGSEHVNTWHSDLCKCRHTSILADPAHRAQAGRCARC